MPYPKWLTRSASELYGVAGMGVHDSQFYVADSAEAAVCRVDNWCEAPGDSLIPTYSSVVALTPTVMKSALGYLWMATGPDNLYRYDSVTGVLNGPYSYCYGLAGTPEDLELFNGEMHVIQRCWPNLFVNNLQIWKFDGTQMVQVIATGAVLNHRPYPYYNLEVYNGGLYFGCGSQLRKWDGATETIIHTFAYYNYVGALLVIDGLLYIATGVGDSTGDDAIAQIWTYDGISVNLLKNTGRKGSIYRFVYRAPELIFAEYTSLTAGYVGRYNLGTGVIAWKYISSWPGQLRSIALNESSDVLWVNHRHSLVWIEKLCAVPCTYFFLA